LGSQWHQREKIRPFLSEIENAAAENEVKKTTNLTEWLSWAQQYADSIDLIHLTLTAFDKKRSAGRR
jgi:hypothetical protein